MPVSGRSHSKLAWVSMVSKTSRDSCTLRRYCNRCSRLNSVLVTSSPTAMSLRTRGHRDLRTDKTTAKFEGDARIGVRGEGAQRRRTVGPQRADHPVVHEWYEGRQRQHRGQPQQV